MQDDNPDFDFGYRPLPEGLLGPTAKRGVRPYVILAGALAIIGTVVGTVVWWHVLREPENPWAIKRDPIEDNPNMRAILDTTDRETKQLLADDPADLKKQLGYCHRVWLTKKHVLHEQYGVDWRTPAEMNPNVAFD
jgi:hypothetical protein